MKLRTNIVKLTTLLLFLSTHLLAQRVISGTVIIKEEGDPLAGANISLKNSQIGTATDTDGEFTLEVDVTDTLVVSYVGFVTRQIPVKGRQDFEIALATESGFTLDEIIIREFQVPLIDRDNSTSSSSISSGGKRYTTESYAEINENKFKKTAGNRLSTFSVDVDAASYSNIRRFINQGSLPPPDAVRIEEMINYFDYDYPQPESRHPFSVSSELAACPWNEDHLLLQIGLQGRSIPAHLLPPSNIVLLLDVSGSMSAPNKLPLLKSSFKLLLDQFREADKVAIVVYAGSSGVVLESTSGQYKERIMEALEKLQSGGSTAGAAGLELAYEIAAKNFIEKGNNRIILATDGDFNVGPSSDEAMKTMIETNREKGIAISVLGFGMGNYKDAKMETIADNGNGNYYYIDNLVEARKVLVKEFGGTLYTIAKDVKVQLKFNARFVEKYRLIGYENRLLENKDFKNDRKDAGDIGAGHSVTALYELVLTKKEKHRKASQALTLARDIQKNNKLVTLKLRYKPPHKTRSKKIKRNIKNDQTSGAEISDNFKFAAAVASFGMLLRDSEFLGAATWQSAIELANAGKGADLEGYREEMIGLMKTASGL